MKIIKKMIPLVEPGLQERSLDVCHAKQMKALMGTVACAAFATLFVAGCANQNKLPAQQQIAVGKAAVSDATVSGAAEYAPSEMASAQDELTRANQAMAAKDYKTAHQLADQAQADAKLAQSKASSAKAQAAAAALQDNIRVMREELDRSSQ